LDTLTEKLETLLWSPRADSLRPALNMLVRLSRFIYAVLRDALTSTLTLRAMGLVYVTILSVVPLIAISFSVLKGFGLHESQLRPFLDTFLEPLGPQGIELTDQVMGFVGNIRGGVLAGVGALLLFYTTVSMIKKVEDSFNYIWRVERSRSFARRFSEYLSVILVGPVIMVTAMALLATVSSNAVVAEVTSFAPIGATLVLIGKLMPYLLVSFGFTLVYWFIPNTQVNFLAAMVGGFSGGVMWATTGMFFTRFVAQSTRNADIYAGFAIVIIALIWLYVSWLILLIGAQIAFYFEHPQYLRIGYQRINIGNKLREKIALGTMTLTAKAFRNSGKPTTIESIANSVGLPGILVQPIANRLQMAGLVQLTSNNRILPGRDPGQIALRDIVQAVRDPQNADIFPPGHWPAEVNEVADELDVAMDEALADRSLYDLLDEKRAAS
jgi:membrane protein